MDSSFVASLSGSFLNDVFPLEILVQDPLIDSHDYLRHHQCVLSVVSASNVSGSRTTSLERGGTPGMILGSSGAVVSFRSFCE